MIAARIRMLPAFVRGTAVLTSGTLLGQAILFLALPALTRVYDPAAFGLLAVMIVTVAMIGTPICLRLEIAIPIPAEDEVAGNLLVASCVFATGFSATLLLASFLWAAPLAQLLNQPGLASYLWMIPLGIWTSALFSIFTMWSIRQKRFADIAQTQVVRSAGGAGGQALLGALGYIPGGLLFGQLLYTALGTFGLASKAFSKEREAFRGVGLAPVVDAIRAHRRFPIFSVPESILDTAANNLPMLLIAAYVGNAEAGALLIAQRVVSAPSSLIGQNISRVFLADAAERYRSGTLGAFTRRAMAHLFLLGVGPFLLLAVAAPFVFPLLFGGAWARAGMMVTWLAPAMLLQLTASSVSTMLAASNNQHISMMLQGAGLVLTAGSVVLGHFLWPSAIFEIFAAGYFLYMLLYVTTLFLVTRK